MNDLNQIVIKFVGALTKRGNRLRARRILVSALRYVAKRKFKPVDVLVKATLSVKPSIGFRPKKKGAVTLKLPSLVSYDKSLGIAVRWILLAASARKDKGFDRRLGSELIDAFRGRGAALKRKEDLYRLAVYNRVFLEADQREQTTNAHVLEEDDLEER